MFSVFDVLGLCRVLSVVRGKCVQVRREPPRYFRKLRQKVLHFIIILRRGGFGRSVFVPRRLSVQRRVDTGKRLAVSDVDQSIGCSLVFDRAFQLWPFALPKDRGPGRGGGAGAEALTPLELQSRLGTKLLGI